MAEAAFFDFQGSWYGPYCTACEDDLIDLNGIESDPLELTDGERFCVRCGAKLRTEG